MATTHYGTIMSVVIFCHFQEETRSIHYDARIFNYVHVTQSVPKLEHARKMGKYPTNLLQQEVMRSEVWSIGKYEVDSTRLREMSDSNQLPIVSMAHFFYPHCW